MDTNSSSVDENYKGIEFLGFPFVVVVVEHCSHSENTIINCLGIASTLM